MISVIIPVYNTASYLDECIQSVVNQTFVDWECILIDDGSTDESGRICDEWESRDDRVKVIHQRNAGVSSARNRGLDVAQGEYIAFIDSDDWVAVDYLERLHEAGQRADVDIVVSGIVQHFADGKSKSFAASDSVFTLDAEHVSEFVELNRQNLLYGPFAEFFRKRLIDMALLRFDEECSYGEDLKFNYAYLEHVSCICNISYTGYHYRILGSGTLSTKPRADAFDTDYSQWRLLRSFYERRQLWSEPAKALLYRRLWGIVYDGIFCRKQSLPKLKQLLSIPEIEELRDYKGVFQCSGWIKWGILHRAAFLFHFKRMTIG